MKKPGFVKKLQFMPGVAGVERSEAPRTIAGVAAAIVLAAANVQAAPPQSWQAEKRFSAAQAHQAVAVDEKHFYAIGSREIGKYDKRTGKQVAHWRADRLRPLIHLNSGVVFEGRLYCAHSNAPLTPRVSSIEIWDCHTLKHVGTHSLGELDGGSLNWLDRRNGRWWAVVAYYDAEGPNSVARTRLSQLDEHWRPTQSWVFPRAVLARFAPGSNSGGAWGSDGRLYCTGHDLGELYVLELPLAGSVLRHVETQPAPVTGQGVAFDRSQPGVLYGINRAKKEVVVSRLK